MRHGKQKKKKKVTAPSGDSHSKTVHFSHILPRLLFYAYSRARLSRAFCVSQRKKLALCGDWLGLD